MRRLLLLLLMIGLAPATAWSGTCIEDDFSTDPFASRWVRSDSTHITWDSVNGEVDFTQSGAAGDHAMIYNTAMGGSNQWAQVAVTNTANGALAIPTFRHADTTMTGFPSVPHYELQYAYGTYDGSSYDAAVRCHSTGCVLINRQWEGLADGTWYAGTVEGTGTSTTFKLWACGASPCGTDPTDPSTWGAAGLTFTCSGCSAFVDTGLYLGFRYYEPTGEPGFSITYYRGGEIGCTVGGGGSTPRRVILVTQALERLIPGQPRLRYLGPDAR